MKRFFTLLCTVCLLTIALCTIASASDFDAAADDLNAIGMFRGTGDSFELDREPNRAEAAIMLVRLYGAEEQATADYEVGTISHPFTDVPNWCAPHVAWLYSNGLTKGLGGRLYGSTDNCSAQNYATFLLRALGYQDGTDFDYDQALDYAAYLGFYDPALFAGAFLRDDLAAMTYQALGTDTKEGSTYLLADLIGSGAVDAEAAKPMTEKIELYRSLITSVSTKTTAMDIETVTKMDVSMYMLDLAFEEFMTTETTSRTALSVADNNIQMAYTETVDDGTGETTSGMWIKDGWMYLSVQAGPLVMKFKSPADDADTGITDTGMAEFDLVELGGVNISALASINSITASRHGSDTVYTLVFNTNPDLSEQINESIGESGKVTSMTFSDITATYTVSSAGTLKANNMAFSADANIDILDEENGEVTPVSAAYDYDITTTIRATGSAVRITYPDFSDYVELPADMQE